MHSPHLTGSLSRRRLLAASAMAAAAVAPAVRSVPAGAQATPAADEGRMVTGRILPGLEAFDFAMFGLMDEFALPGAQLSVANGPSLAVERGYGLADPLTGEGVTPVSRGRIASVSKTITAVTALALVDQDLLLLDEPIFKVIDLAPPKNAQLDPRLGEITLRMLLTHSAGFDNPPGLDPQYQPMLAMEAELLGVDSPPTAEQIVRAMLGFELAYDPGTKSVYSNFGFNVIGRAIEAVTGERFGDVVQRVVLDPCGAMATKLGKTRLADRARDEVLYVAPAGSRLQPSVFPGEGFVPEAYGGYFLEAMDAHGGFIATATDLVRFTLAVDGTRGPALLSGAMLQEMLGTERPGGEAEPGAAGKRSFGLGWGVDVSDAGIEWSHAGALTGTCGSWLARLADGTTVAFVTNTLPTDYPAFFGRVIDVLTQTAAGITAWPEGDLFPDVVEVAPAASGAATPEA